MDDDIGQVVVALGSSEPGRRKISRSRVASIVRYFQGMREIGADDKECKGKEKNWVWGCSERGEALDRGGGVERQG
eukprot:762708-Hanusia_phi.AAC.10